MVKPQFVRNKRGNKTIENGKGSYQSADMFYRNILKLKAVLKCKKSNVKTLLKRFSMAGKQVRQQ
jgi:hypothetical protein